MITEVDEQPSRFGPTIAYMFAQYSPSWWLCRRGIPTASSFDKILTPGGKLSASAHGYINELIADRYQCNPNFFSERPQSRDMAMGSDLEPEARKWYAFQHEGRTIQQVGFCVTPDARFGCSPDALVDLDGCLELKCPRLSTHVGYLRGGEVPKEYLPQVHGHLIVTGRQWCDFVSYGGGNLPALVVRVTPDEYTARLRVALEDFHTAYQNALQRIEAQGSR